VAKNCDKRNYLLKIYRLIRYAVQNRIFRWLDPELYVLNDIQNGLLFGRYRTQTVRNTIPVLTVQSEIGQDVVFLGRCDPEKGIDTILQCEIPSEFGLRLYGPSSEEVPEKFRDVAYGWSSTVSIQQQAKHFRVCIFPSLWLEVDPLVPWEMIALGVPVVASTENVFGQYLLTTAPELAYANMDQLNAILQNFRSDDYLLEIRAKMASLLADERSKRTAIQERFYLEIAN
jgi:glycosyltransferase involved in cell wall biosynthesis